MKLAAEIVVVFVLGVAIITSASAYFAIQRETAMFEREARRDVEQLAAALEEPILVTWRRSGPEDVLTLIRKAHGERHQFSMRWIWVDAPEGDDHHSDIPAGQLRRSPEQSVVSSMRYDESGSAVLLAFHPITVNDPRKGGLEFRGSMKELEEYTRGTIWRTVMFMFAVVAVSGTLMAVAGVVLVGRPLKQLTDKARRAGAGDLCGPVRVRRGDELAELARALNQMCDNLGASQSQLREETARRIAALEQLRHADRLRTVGRLASGIAHELGTPLNVVSGRAGLIASGKLTDTQIAESANSIKTEAQKMTDTVRHLLDFARRKPPQRARADLRHLVSQTIELISTLAEKHGAEVSLVPSETPCRALVDVGQLQQVLTNLLVNAFQSMPEGGKVVVDVKSEIAKPPDRTGRPAQSCHRIDVRDSGRGIPPVDLEHLFEPFFTTKDVGEGTGLGLAIAEGIVHEHGGWIEVESQEGAGSCFSVFLPEEE